MLDMNQTHRLEYKEEEQSTNRQKNKQAYARVWSRGPELVEGAHGLPCLFWKFLREISVKMDKI